MTSVVQVPFCEDESVQLFRVAFFQSDFLQNPYFSLRRLQATPPLQTSLLEIGFRVSLKSIYVAMLV